jgi:hypothetical protein
LPLLIRFVSAAADPDLSVFAAQRVRDAAADFAPSAAARRSWRFQSTQDRFGQLLLLGRGKLGGQGSYFVQGKGCRHAFHAI